MTTTSGTSFFQCGACEKLHPWSAKIAGKTGRCKCGKRMTVPPEPLARGRAAQIPSADDAQLADLYDVTEPAAVDAPPVAPAMPRRARAVAVSRAEPEPERDPHAVDTTRLPPMRKGLKAEVAAPLAPQPMWMYLFLPIALIVVGLVVTPYGAALTADGWKNVGDVAAGAYVNLVAELGFVVVAILGVSALGGISFDEPLWRVALKLCAVATLPGPVGQLVQNSIGDVGGAIVGNFTQLALYFGIFILLFRQALQDTVICVFAIFIIRVPGQSHVIRPN